MVRTQPGGGYRLVIDPYAIDVHRFRDLLRKAWESGSIDEELTLLRSALGLWRGTPFAGLRSAWLDHEVAPQLTEKWFVTTRRRTELELATGPPEPLIAELRDLTGRYPTRESL